MCKYKKRASERRKEVRRHDMEKSMVDCLPVDFKEIFHVFEVEGKVTDNTMSFLRGRKMWRRRIHARNPLNVLYSDL